VSDLQLSASERAVITTILRPSHPVMDALREQLEACLVTNREFTGTGFFTTLHVPDYVPEPIDFPACQSDHSSGASRSLL
jgi:hypothetical protein